MPLVQMARQLVVLTMVVTVIAVLAHVYNQLVVAQKFAKRRAGQLSHVKAKWITQSKQITA